MKITLIPQIRLFRGRMMVIMWIQALHIMPWEGVPRLPLPRHVALLRPQKPLGVPTLLIYFLTNFVSTLRGRGGNSKKTNNRIKNIQDQQVYSTRDSESREV